jgi:hypothetical protein
LDAFESGLALETSKPKFQHRLRTAKIWREAWVLAQFARRSGQCHVQLCWRRTIHRIATAFSELLTGQGGNQSGRRNAEGLIHALSWPAFFAPQIINRARDPLPCEEAVRVAFLQEGVGSHCCFERSIGSEHLDHKVRCAPGVDWGHFIYQLSNSELLCIRDGILPNDVTT